MVLALGARYGWLIVPGVAALLAPHMGREAAAAHARLLRLREGALVRATVVDTRGTRTGSQANLYATFRHALPGGAERTTEIPVFAVARTAGFLR